MNAAVAELVLGGEPDEVPAARRFAMQTLADIDPATADDVALIVTELVTNGLLHGQLPVTLRISRAGERVRIEVEDAGRELPVRIRSNTDTMTGRGLGLVAALATNWGVEATAAGGKVVWAEVDESQSVEPVDPELDVDELLAAFNDADFDEPMFTIELGAVPTDLLLAAKAHIDNLVREFTLADAASASSGTALPRELADLVRTVVHGFSMARSEIKRQAVRAGEQGLSETRLVLTLPESAARAGEQYLAALDEADRYARTARLLTLETPPVHRLFRRWYVEAIVQQLRRQAAGLPPIAIPSFMQRLSHAVTTLAPLQSLAARLSLLQRATAALTGARSVDEIVQTVVDQATSELGIHTARVYLLGDDGILRSAAVGSHGDPAMAHQYEQFALTDDLPGAVALRSGEPVIIRDLADLADRFPALAGMFTDERSLLIAPLVVGAHQLGVLSLTFHGPNEIDEHSQRAFLTTLADVTAQALERAMASATASDALDRLAFLADASAILSTSLDHRMVLSALADLVVPRLADWCVIQLLEGGELRTVALTHHDPAKVRWARDMEQRYPTDMNAPTGAPNVIRTGMSELYSDISEELLLQAAIDEGHLRALRELGMTSVLVVPLTGRTGTFGALTMIRSGATDSYDDRDVAFAEDLARRAALAVENARAFREQSGRLAELTRVAEAAQHAILAPPPGEIGPVALAARYVSAEAEALVGGDLYEIVRRDSSVRLLIGDVRGKGLEAVRTATVALGEFRAAAADIDDLCDVARQIDRRLRPYLGPEDFVTALLAEVEDDGRFRVCSCGHPPALLLSRGELVEVQAPTTLPLGLGANPESVSGRLRTGDRLLLYTDGLLEACDRSHAADELVSVIRPAVDGPLDEVPDRLVDVIRSFAEGVLGDDVAVLVAQYMGD
jgi:GAF domain-containing protein/anti-sigma regulatory factor (Ser/Thr protein kinase)